MSAKAHEVVGVGMRFREDCELVGKLRNKNILVIAKTPFGNNLCEPVDLANPELKIGIKKKIRIVIMDIKKRCSPPSSPKKGLIPKLHDSN